MTKHRIDTTSFEPRALGAAELVVVCVSVSTSLALPLWPLVLGPSMARTFEDFEATLPLLTRMALTPWVAGLGMIVLAVAAVATLAVPGRARRLAAGGAVLGVAVLGHVGFLYGMYAPLFQLSEL